MKGGDASPAVNSPMNKFRKRLGTNGTNSPAGARGAKATPLGRQAAKNAFSKSKSPAPSATTGGGTSIGMDKQTQKQVSSPVRPQVLDFGGGGGSTSESLSQYSDQDPDVHRDI
jgi:hypothetical protein